MYARGRNAGEKLEPVSCGRSTAGAAGAPAPEHRRPAVAGAIATQPQGASTKKNPKLTKNPPQNPSTNQAEVFYIDDLLTIMKRRLSCIKCQ